MRLPLNEESSLVHGYTKLSGTTRFLRIAREVLRITRKGQNIKRFSIVSGESMAIIGEVSNQGASQ